MKRLPVTRNSRADEDLIEIWQYIAYDSLRAADRVLDTIDQRLSQLSAMPQLGPPREDLGPGIRHLVIGAYLAFYSVGETEVTVLRVVHGHRNITQEDLTG